jgi:outer membrane protein assembly factor BamB
MTRRLFSLLIAGIALASAACSNSDNSPNCGFSGQTTLADPNQAAWPKFARDTANTGRIEGVTLPAAPGVRWVFPDPNNDAPLQPISNAALVGADRQVRLVAVSTETGLANVRLYALDAGTGAVLNKITPTPAATPETSPTEEAPTIASGTSVASTPLLGADGTIFIPLTNGIMGQFEEDNETALVTANIGGFISASPNIATDGTIYIGSLGGAFAGVCPNGVARFALAAGSSQSSAVLVEGATATDRVIILAGDDAQVRAVDYLGRQSWSFFASAAVRASVVLDRHEGQPVESADRIYVADEAGWVFAIRLADGGPLWSRRPGRGAPISATPALGTDDLYVADESGGLYALRAEDGNVVWTCVAGGAIRSSLAVAAAPAGDVVVFGADDATVYAVDATAAARCTATDACGCDEVALWTIPVDAPVGRSSPSIDFDGTVYIGTEGGRLYAIGAPAQEPTSTRTPTSTPTPEPSASNGT